MISGVVRYQKSFAQQALSISPTKWLKQIRIRLFDQGLKVLEIAPDRSNALIPRMR